MQGQDALPKNSFRDTAVPSDVRKASGLPAGSILNFGLRPGFGAQPQIRRANRRKRGALPHIRRHSRIPLAALLGKPTQMGRERFLRTSES